MPLTRSLALAAAALALAPAAQAAPLSPGWRPGVRAATGYAAHRAGAVSFSVRTEHRVWGQDARRVVPCASVLKAMLLVAYLRRAGVRDRPLGAADRALLVPMVRWSDNVTATSVRNIVGDAGLVRLARRAGMRHFRPAAPIWGNSSIDAADQSRYLLHIDRLVPRRHRAYALRLLASVVRSQRWGLARVRPPGWALYFKGGWGSGSGAVDHQVGLLRRGRRRVAVAIMTTSSPSHEYAKATLEGVGRRLLRHLGAGSIPAGSAAH
jgi:beta-lactamase family protein